MGYYMRKVAESEIINNFTNACNYIQNLLDYINNIKNIIETNNEIDSETKIINDLSTYYNGLSDIKNKIQEKNKKIVENAENVDNIVKQLQTLVDNQTTFNETKKYNKFVGYQTVITKYHQYKEVECTTEGIKLGITKYQKTQRIITSDEITYHPKTNTSNYSTKVIKSTTIIFDNPLKYLDNSNINI